MPKKKVIKKGKSKAPAVVRKQSVGSYQQALSDIKQLVQQARYS